MLMSPLRPCLVTRALCSLGAPKDTVSLWLCFSSLSPTSYHQLPTSTSLFSVQAIPPTRLLSSPLG